MLSWCSWFNWSRLKEQQEVVELWNAITRFISLHIITSRFIFIPLFTSINPTYWNAPWNVSRLWIQIILMTIKRLVIRETPTHRHRHMGTALHCTVTYCTVTYLHWLLGTIYSSHCAGQPHILSNLQTNNNSNYGKLLSLNKIKCNAFTSSDFSSSSTSFSLTYLDFNSVIFAETASPILRAWVQRFNSSIHRTRWYHLISFIDHE